MSKEFKLVSNYGTELEVEMDQHKEITISILHPDHYYSVAIYLEPKQSLEFIKNVIQLEYETMYRPIWTYINDKLGKALGYPEYPEGSGIVCTGEHVPETLISEAASYITKLQDCIETALKCVDDGELEAGLRILQNYKEFDKDEYT